MNIYEQIEWHGIAEKGAGRRDPMTSVVEFNTQPGRETFQKIPSRQDYLSGRAPAPSVRFSNAGSYFTLMDGPTARTFNNATTQSMGAATLYHTAGTVWNLCCCFKHDSYNTLDPGQQPLVFAGGRATQYGFCLTKTSGSWKLQYVDATARHTFTASMDEGAWYWADARAEGTTADVALYKDGSTTFTETARASTMSTARGVVQYFIGGSEFQSDTFWNGEVAYAAVNVPTIATGFPTAWQAAPGDSAVYSFYIDQPRHTMFPAQALLSPGTSQYVWTEQPPTFWVEDGVASPMAAVGFQSVPGKSTVFDSEGIEIFRDLTVFMFYVTGLVNTVELLRNENSSFRVWNYSQSDKLEVWWPPEHETAGSLTYGGLIKTESNSGSVTASAGWFAVEVNPTNQQTAMNINIYSCDIHATGQTWTDITDGTAGVGAGIASETLSDSWFLMRGALGCTANLMDFRVVVGDQGWKTAHNITSLQSSMPKGVVAWLNNATNSDYINEEKVKLYSVDNFADVASWPIACADRVDGMIRYYLSPYHSRVGRGGCQHIVRGPMPQVDDMIADSTGDLSFTTDAYYYDGGTVRPQLATRSPNRSRVAAMGSHRYIVNNAPLHLVRDYERQVGTPPFYIEGIGTASTVQTVDFEGNLGWDARYKYVVTLYDPLTGDEGFPAGPFSFVTASAPASTAVDYGTPGCAFVASNVIHADRSITDLKIKAYRYSTVQGTYYYETMIPVGPGTYSSAEAAWESTVEIPFRIDNELLLLGNEVNLENRLPPEHSVSTIYDGRGFYVDALRQSRVYFSRRYQVGTVPYSNLIWTDEGAGGAILGFLDSPDGLLLLRERSIWIIPPFATDDTAWAYPLHPNIGCVSGSCAVWAGGLLWWASPLGLHSWDGQGQPQNHTQRVSGLDKKVWNHAPRSTIAYYDSREFKVVIACDGTGLGVDVRSGAAALISAPERCYLDLQSASYSGPLYGHVGGVFKQVTGNASLTLSATAETCGNVVGVSSAGACTALTWSWADGGKSATHIIGVHGNATAFQAGATYLSPTSDIGRSFTSLDDGYGDIWTVTICDNVAVGTTASGVMLRTNQTLLDWQGIEAIPFYYKSQPAYVGRSRTDHYFERLDFYTDDEAGTTDGACAVTFTSWIPGQVTAMAVTAPTATITPNDVHEMTLLQRGNRFQYTMFDTGTAGLPNIMEVGIHFRDTRERGGQHEISWHP